MYPFHIRINFSGSGAMRHYRMPSSFSQRRDYFSGSRMQLR
jgi:hypothetical protein